MKKIFIYFILFFICFSGICRAGQTREDCRQIYKERLASGHYNYEYYEGYAWNSISENDKLIYLNGLWAGWDLSRDKMFKLSPENKDNFLAFQNRVVGILGPSIKDWREILNNFYNYPENYAFSVYQAILKTGQVEY